MWDIFKRPKYRILEESDRYGDVRFLPQARVALLWYKYIGRELRLWDIPGNGDPCSKYTTALSRIKEYSKKKDRKYKCTRCITEEDLQE